ncbi:hypothetical protein L3i22_042550 [Actinoplanes sp. L3-i22]|nr:hypothetical protein L3i22_042550 [Actinoplanes sp. L3-i22]
MRPQKDHATALIETQTVDVQRNAVQADLHFGIDPERDQCRDQLTLQKHHHPFPVRTVGLADPYLAIRV